MSIMASQKSHYDNDAQSQTLPAYCDGLGSNFCVFGDVDASKIVATWRSYADPLPGRRTLMLVPQKTESCSDWVLAAYTQLAHSWFGQIMLRPAPLRRCSRPCQLAASLRSLNTWTSRSSKEVSLIWCCHRTQASSQWPSFPLRRVSSALYKTGGLVCYFHEPLPHCSCFLLCRLSRYSVIYRQQDLGISMFWCWVELNDPICAIVWWVAYHYLSSYVGTDQWWI